MKLDKDLFKLTKEQEETSKTLYNGKIVKCLVVPYHSSEEDKYDFVSEKIELDCSENKYMFPEKHLSDGQTSQFMYLVANGYHQEVLIVTASQNIILDMYDGCVRILTEMNEIVDCPEKTFGANIHTINHSILNNKSHQKPRTDSYGNDFYVKSINEVNDNKSFTQKEYDELMGSIENIGEPLTSTKLRSMLQEKSIIGKSKEIEFLESELKRLKKIQDKLGKK